MYCAHCGKQIVEGAAFCSSCGKPTNKNEFSAAPVRDIAPHHMSIQRQQETSGKSIASLTLGIIGAFAWLLPLIGYPVTIVGLILGINGRSRGSKGMATAGIVLCIIALVLTIINSAIGAYMGATGQLWFQ